MTMGKSESVRRYGQRVKALIQKLTTEISPTIQVEWYVAGFPEKMGFQIRQARPTTLNEAMEAAQNYENSAQSLWKSLKGLEKREKSKSGKRDGDGRSTWIPPRHPVLTVRPQGAPTRKVPIVIQVRSLGRDLTGIGRVKKSGRSR